MDGEYYIPFKNFKYNEDKEEDKRKNDEILKKKKLIKTKINLKVIIKNDNK